MSYAYVNTRVRAMKAKLVQPDSYAKLLKMSVPEIAHFLEEQEYKREIDSLAARYEGADLLETALNKNLAADLHKVFRISIRESRDQVAAFLGYWDVWNVKTVLRGKYSSAPAQEIEDTLIPAGSLDDALLRKIASEAKNVEEAAEAFRDTEYGPVLANAMQSFHSTKQLAGLENALDTYYYKSILDQTTGKLAQFVRMEIDALNIMSLLRLKRAGSAAIEFIPGGKLRVPELKALASGSYEDAAKRLSERGAIIDAPLPLVERSLLAERLRFGYRMLRDYKLGINPIIGYFIAKRIEIENIRLLVRAKQSGIAEAEIEKRLVTV
jgi:V/A-type H+-transporting ATPase subunit C